MISKLRGVINLLVVERVYQVEGMHTMIDVCAVRRGGGPVF